MIVLSSSSSDSGKSPSVADARSTPSTDEFGPDGGRGKTCTEITEVTINADLAPKSDPETDQTPDGLPFDHPIYQLRSEIPLMERMKYWQPPPWVQDEPHGICLTIGRRRRISRPRRSFAQDQDQDDELVNSLSAHRRRLQRIGFSGSCGIPTLDRTYWRKRSTSDDGKRKAKKKKNVDPKSLGSNEVTFPIENRFHHIPVPRSRHDRARTPPPEVINREVRFLLPSDEQVSIDEHPAPGLPPRIEFLEAAPALKVVPFDFKASDVRPLNMELISIILRIVQSHDPGQRGNSTNRVNQYVSDWLQTLAWRRLFWSTNHPELKTNRFQFGLSSLFHGQSLAHVTAHFATFLWAQWGIRIPRLSQCRSWVCAEVFDRRSLLDIAPDQLWNRSPRHFDLPILGHGPDIPTCDRLTRWFSAVAGLTPGQIRLNFW